ncbi:MAG: AGE family epimerase/isomerase [Planctomycetota bacterium]|nr:MAG: AGE family epimerase/isomerase [Planctomycetota bacterium]
MDFSNLLGLYRETLVDNVVPFWTRYAIDANGGINTCISDEGCIISRDRWGWSQWRAVWVFSKLYNTIEARPEWLKIAQGIYSFLSAYGPLDDGHWPLLMDGDGRLKRGYESIYTDGFAIYGLVELWRATGEDHLHELALKTFRATEAALNGSEPPPAHPYPILPDRLVHGLSMIFSLAYHELAEVTGDSVVSRAAQMHHRRVMETFLRSDRGLVLEWLHADGSEIEPPAGTVVLPGHAIESMWFQMHIADTNGDRATINRAIEAIHRHLEIGWDTEYGGLFLAVDADGREEVAWDFHDSKIWWPHTEALYATLLAYLYCQQSWCLEWHERIRDYSFTHYPVKSHGEWKQKLDRRGNPITDVVALPVKDPFHLPRALIYCIEVLKKLISNRWR